MSGIAKSETLFVLKIETRIAILKTERTGCILVMTDKRLSPSLRHNYYSKFAVICEKIKLITEAYKRISTTYN